MGDQPVDVQRVAAALRRGAGLIAAVTAVITVAVVVISAALPKSYEASATLVFNPATTALQPTDSTSIERELATSQAFVQSPVVTAAAARTLSETPAAVKNAIQSSTDPNANIITITATGPRPVLAARRANAVARAFLTSQEMMQSAGLQAEVVQLQAQIARLSATPDSGAQISALRDRINALQISAAGIPSQLQVGEPATAPTSAASPKPALNGLVALAVSLLIMTLFVLARDQFRPRFTSPRALGRALGCPVLVSIPYRSLLAAGRRRRTVAATGHRAYDALRGALTAAAADGSLHPGRRRRPVMAAPDDRAYDILRAGLGLDDTPDAGCRAVLITSATRGEGKSTVTVGLGQSVARMGQRVLLVSGDLRSPTLHQHLGLSRAPGLADCLSVAARGARRLGADLDKWVRTAPGNPSLDCLTAGTAHPDPASLLSRRALEITFAALRRLPYDYVLIDSPPILGAGDAQLFVRLVDDVLLVARLDAISADDVEDLNDLFARLPLQPIGVVAVGARTERSASRYPDADGLANGAPKAPMEDVLYPRRASASRNSSPREREPGGPNGDQRRAPAQAAHGSRRSVPGTTSHRSSPSERESGGPDGDESQAPPGGAQA